MTKKSKKKKTDKYGHQISGKRLNIARDLKSKRLKDMVDEFNVNAETIQKWQQRGIPKRKLENVADYFKVEEWVFDGNVIDEEAFKEIIRDPTLMKKYYPVLAKKESPLKIIEFKKNIDGKARFSKSKPFHIPGDSVLISASFWSSQKGSFLWISLVNKASDDEYGHLCSALQPRCPEMRVNLWQQRESVEQISGQEFFRNLDPGIYFLNVHCDYNFDIAVYNIKRFPDKQ